MNNNTLDPPLRGKLIGSHHCTASGHSATGAAPILALCRQLLAAGLNPDQALEVYRGATLAIRVRSIGEGARLTVKDNRLGRPCFARCQDRPASDAAVPPVGETAPEGLGGHVQ
jgi:hypothetical protein